MTSSSINAFIYLSPSSSTSTHFIEGTVMTKISTTNELAASRGNPLERIVRVPWKQVHKHRHQLLARGR